MAFDTHGNNVKLKRFTDCNLRLQGVSQQFKLDVVYNSTLVTHLKLDAVCTTPAPHLKLDFVCTT